MASYDRHLAFCCQFVNFLLDSEVKYPPHKITPMICFAKVGDIINVISKPPMGIWTGLLNNKVGNFKFIYVDVLADKEKEEAPKIRPQKLCRRPRPNTLLELLEQLQLEVRTGFRPGSPLLPLLR